MPTGWNPRCVTMTNMFPDSLRAFHVTAQSGSIRKASEQLGIEPSSVSRRIAQLETLVGTKLLERSSGGVALTHAGHLIADFAQTTVNGFDTLRLDLNDLAGSRGHIRVAMVESVVSAGPIEAASRFRQGFAGVSFEFTVLPATSVVESVLSQKADIGISLCVAPNELLTVDAIVLEPIVLVFGKSRLPAAPLPRTLAELSEIPLALPPQDFQLRKIVDQAAGRLGMTLRPVMTSNSFEALRNFARFGSGATILPWRALATDRQGKELIVVPLEHPEFKTTSLDLVTLKHLRMPRITRLYLQKLREAMEAGNSERGSEA